jgi:hypothetical protein
MSLSRALVLDVISIKMSSENQVTVRARVACARIMLPPCCVFKQRANWTLETCQLSEGN